MLEFLTESADIFSIEPLCFLRRSKDGDNNGETAVKGFNPALSSLSQCCVSVLQSQFLGGMISFDDLCFVFRAFQAGEGDCKVEMVKAAQARRNALHYRHAHARASLKNAKK